MFYVLYLGAPSNSITGGFSFIHLFIFIFVNNLHSILFYTIIVRQIQNVIK